MEKADELIKDIKASFIDSYRVGSRVTCNPPPINTDQDILIYVKNMDIYAEAAKLLGFVIDGDKKEYNTLSKYRFYSMKKDGDSRNLLISSSYTFIDRFLVATKLVKKLNLLNRDDRIEVFQTIRSI